MNELCFYIASISLQVSGALMLLFFSISTKRESIIRSFARSHLIVKDNNTGNISYKHEVFVNEYRLAYYSKISFGFIALGYFLGIFGNIGTANKCSVAFYVFVSIVILRIIALCFVECLIKCKKVQQRITDSELKALGIEEDLGNIPTCDIDGDFK